MKKIESLTEYGDLVKEFKKRDKKVVTNCFFLPDEVKYMTERQRLFWEQDKEALCFFVREESCFRVYYHMEREAQVHMPEEIREPMLLDYVFRSGKETQLSALGCEKWVEAGFKPYKNYYRMECMAENFCPPSDQEELLCTYPMEALLPEDYEAVQELWKQGLDVYGTSFPDRQEFGSACEKRQVFGIRLLNGLVGAAIMCIPKGRTGFIQHVAVSSGFHGLGMGRTLFCAASQYLFDQCQVSKINLWVDEENTHAVRLYKKMGFCADGIISRQFKLEKI